jgi:hypothetical protein
MPALVMSQSFAQKEIDETQKPMEGSIAKQGLKPV